MIDFDKKMEEIRLSLNAIASRDSNRAASVSSTTTYQDAKREYQPVKSSTTYASSFDEYLREFKRDLHKYSVRFIDCLCVKNILILNM